MKFSHAATAPDQLTAEMWLDLLREEGVPAFIEPRDSVSFLGLSTMPCRILVPEDMVEKAKEILADFE